MISLNLTGLSPFNQAVQEEVSATLEEFNRFLYSDEGIHSYRETLQRCHKTSRNAYMSKVPYQKLM